MEENSLPIAPYSYLYSDGLVRDKQPLKVVSSCRLNMHRFPFDIQNCTLTFNSYLLRCKWKTIHTLFLNLYRKLCVHFYEFILWLSSIFFSATALRLSLKSSVEEMLKYSKKVMTSMGEWELVGLTANNFLQPASYGELYEELRFAVRNIQD